MDDLDRLYRRLVHNIRATRPEYLQIPFSVQELYEHLVPYRHNRREMGIETNQDYEMAIARLLSGERGYLRSDPAMQEVLQRELESDTGDPGIFKEYALAPLTLTPVVDTSPMPVPQTRLASMHGLSETLPITRSNAEPVETTTGAYDALAPGTTEPAATPTPVPSLLSSLTSTPVPTGCRFCGGTIPEGRDVHYCPHCGENLKTQRCPACGAEMDTGWKFCVGCGRRAGS